ncbi:hypothetical protein UF64_00490 [Thalassospira sp. HJ]|uniref:hypothetical protein n=1 Tax=Thalassospira sp. HJ TaxID=1616823 RepID=UPI0005CEABF4|nr:hypothetical protein [Thalassospira sp. HJ]KJE37186.1 hypothetical protein UF64_00490 [Thalassospira sp. HJ]
MEQIRELLSGLPLLGIVLIAFLVGALYGSNFDGEDWETLTAGTLGLLAGAFALLAAKAQISAQKEQSEENRRIEAKLANTRYYLLGREVGDLCMQFANATSERLETAAIGKREFSTIYDALIATEIPDAPLTCPEEVTSASINLRFLRSRLLIFFSTIVREMDNTPEDHGARIIPDENPNGIHQSLTDMAVMGKYFRDCCETELDKVTID